MGRKPTGGAYERGGRFYGRPMISKKRTPVLLPGVASLAEARERAAILADVVVKLETHGHHDRVEPFVAELAAAALAGVAEIVALAEELCAGKIAKVGQLPAAKLPTLTELNDAWVSGDLHRRFPDYIKAKRSSRPEGWRFNRHIKPHVGDVTVDAFTRDHAKLVMSKLPEALSPITRRHVAQQMNRLLGMAVWPLEMIAHSPIPRGFLPKMNKRKTSPFLYPNEEAQLLACKEVPIERRVLYALLAREGLRRDEGAFLTWAQLDLVQGTITLDDHKTADEAGARSWALDAGTAEMLRRWRKLHPKGAAVFPRYTNGGVLELGHLADYLRADLKAAGVEREELFTAGPGRMRLRAHDLRTSFCTLALAAGRGEDWCTDRTGHTEGKMLRRYKRAARTAKELNLGWWHPAHEAIPEMADPAVVATGASRSGNRGAGEADATQPKAASIRGVEAHPSGKTRAQKAQDGGAADPVAVGTISAETDGVGETGTTSTTPGSPVGGMGSGDAAAMRRALARAVDRGDHPAAKIFLAELERLEAEARAAALGATVTPIGAARKRGDR